MRVGVKYLGGGIQMEPIPEQKACADKEGRNLRVLHSVAHELGDERGPALIKVADR